MTFVSTGLMEDSVYEALDTDHHGHPLREADRQTVKYRERLANKLVLQVGASDETHSTTVPCQIFTIQQTAPP